MNPLAFWRLTEFGKVEYIWRCVTLLPFGSVTLSLSSKQLCVVTTKIALHTGALLWSSPCPVRPLRVMYHDIIVADFRDMGFFILGFTRSVSPPFLCAETVR